MKINVGENNFFKGNLEHRNVTMTRDQETNEKQKNTVRLTISDVSKEYYRKTIQQMTGKTNSYGEMTAIRSKLINGVSPDLSYDFLLGEELRQYDREGVYKSVEDKAKDTLKAYANLYDRIVQGYESGTREVYIEDKQAEQGIRALTQEEEIVALNSSYKKYSDYLEVQAKQEPEIRKALEVYKRKIASIVPEKSDLIPKYYESINIKKQNEALPENISEKMIDASINFIKQRSTEIGKTMSLQNILDKISIFKS